jgi:hypothetical protein
MIKRIPSIPLLSLQLSLGVSRQNEWKSIRDDNHGRIDAGIHLAIVLIFPRNFLLLLSLFSLPYIGTGSTLST